jgi:hypothetical protein
MLPAGADALAGNTRTSGRGEDNNKNAREKA